MNSCFFKLPGSWCFITALEKEHRHAHMHLTWSDDILVGPHPSWGLGEEVTAFPQFGVLDEFSHLAFLRGF